MRVERKQVTKTFEDVGAGDVFKPVDEDALWIKLAYASDAANAVELATGFPGWWRKDQKVIPTNAKVVEL